ncbi:MAG: 50S ribosomal protein L17 [Thermodesulfobacterium geofontis]|uniref:Large ribosomal subunit protein bL17 n=1 Tax=Thermodesulfobacterium geofontis TaxID=1295609 RepID=A0A2N7PMZ9_9BACT|nr:MAG: 50S ribosomal protein L17 [Thermodesulfobacterium geofontis]
MRHRKVSRKLGRDTEHHKAILRNMVTDLFKHGKVTTTLAKAKELRRVADKMITLAKKGDLASRRRALAFIRDKNVVRKLFNQLREKYLDRAGGYTRIIKVGPRRGDASMMAVVELVEEKLTTKGSKIKKERLKKVLEFIEKKKREYGLIKESVTEEKPEEKPEEPSQSEVPSNEGKSE